MTKDIFRETLTSIRNAILVKSFGVEVKKTRITKSLSRILYKEGLIDEVSEQQSWSNNKKYGDCLFLTLKYIGSERIPVIKDLQRVSRPGLRFYTNHKEIPEILGGLGIVILSTSQGLISDREARSRKLGGEILCSIWLLDFLFYL